MTTSIHGSNFQKIKTRRKLHLIKSIYGKPRPNITHLLRLKKKKNVFHKDCKTGNDVCSQQFYCVLLEGPDFE